MEYRDILLYVIKWNIKYICEIKNNKNMIYINIYEN